MKNQPMSFKSYIWPFNPQKIQVEYSRHVRNLKLPLFGSVLQDLGCDKRVVTGTGEFIGAGCAEEFRRLASVFTEGGSGTLRLPGVPPFQAAFTSLKMIGEAQPDCVTYSFVFVEEGAVEMPAGTVPGGIYVCAGGENLWSVANRFHTDVDTLKRLNPMIQWPNGLEKGQRVVLP